MGMSGEQEREDRATYDNWKLVQEAAYIAADNMFWFSTVKAARMQNKRSAAPDDVFAGPWWAIRPWLTQEAIDWFEVAGNPRYTFTDWQRMQRDHRAQAAQFDADQSDPLATLEYERELHARRGELITEARNDGASWAQIMKVTGLSRMAVYSLAHDYAHPPVIYPPKEPLKPWQLQGFADEAAYRNQEVEF